MDLDKLTERRKADRKQIAEALCRSAEERGATAEIDRDIPHELWVSIEAARGLRITVDLDGRSRQPDVYVLSWHMATDSDARLAYPFPGDINPFHRRKSTVVACGVRDMLESVGQGLTAAADGSAFERAEVPT